MITAWSIDWRFISLNDRHLEFIRNTRIKEKTAGTPSFFLTSSDFFILCMIPNHLNLSKLSCQENFSGSVFYFVLRFLEGSIARKWLHQF